MSANEIAARFFSVVFLLGAGGIIGLGYMWVRLGRLWLEVDADWDRVMRNPLKRRHVNGEMVLGGVLMLMGAVLFVTIAAALISMF